MPGKRPYQGPPSKARNPQGVKGSKGSVQVASKKQRRGPKAYIDLPLPSKQSTTGAGRRSGQASDSSGSDDEELRLALGAEDMAGDGIDSSGDEGDSASENPAPGHTSAAENGRRSVAARPGSSSETGFLLKLDTKGMSK